MGKYITLEEGTDFRKIAQIMTDAGYQMNHATARNVLMMSLASLMKYVASEMGMPITEEQTREILRDQNVHEALSDILFAALQEMYLDEEEEEEEAACEQM